MAHQVDDISEWIQREWSEDQFRFDDIQADFKVLELSQTESSVRVKLSFVSDESRKGIDSESLVMFRYDPENYNSFFPCTVQIVTFETEYTWTSSEDCEQLASDYEEDNLNVNVDYVDWDDPRLSDECVGSLLNSCDQLAIAETLVGLYGATKRMPDFVPDRLKPYFAKFIEKYALK